MDHLNYFRDLVRNELIPRVVVLEIHMHFPHWKCTLCGVHTRYDFSGVDGSPSQLSANHATHCKLKRAATVWE